MSKVQLQGNVSGTGIFTIASPNSNTNRTIDLPDATGTIQVSGNPISGTTGTFTGLLDISAAGAGQIKFPATQNASSNANTLDDYEEGTFTPTVGGTWTSNPTDLAGRYTKIGDLVCIWVTWKNGTKASAISGHIAGMPFTVSSAATGTVSDVDVVDRGIGLLDTGSRIFLTNTSFSASTNYTSYVYRT